jgi:hypothetical protein
MMRKLVLALLLALLLTNVARADLEGPIQDFTKLTPDGGYIFVMLAQPRDDVSKWRRTQSDRKIRELYSQSGLYSAWDPKKLYYTIDWNADSVSLSNYGDYVVRWGFWANNPSFEDIALEFYYRGKLLRSYRVTDLTKRYDAFSYSASHYQWLESDKYDLDTNQLQITLKSGERFIFDATTGEIIEKDVSKSVPVRDMKEAMGGSEIGFVLSMREQLAREAQIRTTIFTAILVFILSVCFLYRQELSSFYKKIQNKRA